MILTGLGRYVLTSTLWYHSQGMEANIPIVDAPGMQMLQVCRDSHVQLGNHAKVLQ